MKQFESSSRLISIPGRQIIVYALWAGMQPELWKKIRTGITDGRTPADAFMCTSLGTSRDKEGRNPLEISD